MDDIRELGHAGSIKGGMAVHREEESWEAEPGTRKT